MRRPLFIAGICLLLLGLAATPADARRRRSYPRTEWRLSATIAGVYDDNPLRFSPRDQNDYLGDPSAVPTPLSSVDDFQSELHLAPEFRWRAPFTLMIGADYRVKAVNRMRNEFSNYETHSLGISVRPRVQGYRWSARTRVFSLPSYYLRAYTDRDHGEKHAARFANRDYEAAIRYRLSDALWLEGRGAFGSYYYNRKFTEYDSEYREGTIGASYAFPRELQLSGGYTRRISDNIGKAQPFNTRLPEDASSFEDSEYGDADFHEDEFNLHGSAPVPWIRITPVDAAVSYRLRRRVYVTERSTMVDPLHRSRLDNRHEITIGTGARIARGLRMQAYFSYEERVTESPVSWVPHVKNFIRRQVGAELTYAIR